MNSFCRLVILNFVLDVKRNGMKQNFYLKINQGISLLYINKIYWLI